MAASIPARDVLHPESQAFYCRGLLALSEAHVPFLVGGAYALARYTGVVRHTKDFDIFIHRRDHERALDTLAAAGCRTELTFPHWLAKAFCGEDFIDVIFGSGNGVADVDDTWFAHGVPDEVLGITVRLAPPEEMIWSKAFVMERERYDGADVAHILRARAHALDWARLIRRFDRHWRVLLSHLVLFGFIYPSEEGRIPRWVMQALVGRLQAEIADTPPADRLCQGTMLSRAQYLIDVDDWGYRDARRLPQGTMTVQEIAQWTAAIEDEHPTDGDD